MTRLGCKAGSFLFFFRVNTLLLEVLICKIYLTEILRGLSREVSFFPLPMICFICSFSLVPKKTSVVWSVPHHYRKDTRVNWSFGLLCAPQCCRDYENSDTVLSSNTVTLKHSKSSLNIFCGARQLPMGNQRPTKTRPFGLEYLLIL